MRVQLEGGILIIGAGLAGLMAATALQATGRRITILEQAPTVGGRLATEPLGSGLADTGAQFFTVRESAFRQWVDQWLAAGLVYPWSTGWSDGSLATTPSDGFPRYAVQSGMNALAHHLAHQLDPATVTICTGVHCTAIQQQENGWQVWDEKGIGYRASTLILTPPVPQALALLDAGQVMLAPQDRAALTRIVYAPCLCGLFEVEGAVHLPAPGAIQRPGAAISWMADNQRKGISATTLITVHASPDFSRDHAATTDAAILALLENELQPFLAAQAVICTRQLKRWPYALPLVIHPARYLQAAALPPLYFGGDAFGGPRVEGAALSGLTMGATVRGM